MRMLVPQSTGRTFMRIVKTLRASHLLRVKRFDMLEFDQKLCGDCGGCVAVCPYGALELFVSGLLIRKDLCTLCQNCIIFCPVGALKITNDKKQTRGINSRCPAEGKDFGARKS